MNAAPVRVPHEAPAAVHSLPLPFSARNPPPGHLQSIFSLPLNRGNVSEVGPGAYPSAATIFSQYTPTTDAQQRGPSCREAKSQGDQSLSWRWRVCGDPGWGTPLVLRQYAKSMRAFERFASDDRMRQAYTQRRDDFSPPPLLRAVELGRRREDRRLSTRSMSVSAFLDSYRQVTASESEEERILYAVSPLPALLAEDVPLPSFLRCGGAARKLHSLNLWMSSGGTESVLHSDQYDNLNCVLSGSKRFLLIDSAYYGIVADTRCGWYDAEKAARQAGDGDLPEELKRLKHGYGAFGGGVNVSAVDLLRFPCFANLPFTEATLRAGDCLLLPRHWMHHVASDGGRSIALNLWWKRPERFDSDDCVAADPATGAALYDEHEPVPAADCAIATWGDAPPEPSRPPCTPARRRGVVRVGVRTT